MMLLPEETLESKPREQGCVETGLQFPSSMNNPLSLSLSLPHSSPPVPSVIRANDPIHYDQSFWKRLGQLQPLPANAERSDRWRC